MADWCSIPADILYTISLCLPTAIDILRFRSVCAAWRFAVNPQPLFSKTCNSTIPDFDYKGWHNLVKRIIYVVQSTTRPHVSWIVKLEQGRYDKNLVHLVHPLFKSRNERCTEKRIPKSLSFMNFRVKELGQECILQTRMIQTPMIVRRRSVVLNDSGDQFVLLTISNGTLEIYKSGDDKWERMNDMRSFYDDVIVRGGKFYAVCLTGKLVFVDHVNMKTSIMAKTGIHGVKYLVDCDGELLLVSITYEFKRACEFEICRFDENTGELIKVCDLGDRMLFLSDHCKFSVSVSDIFGGDRGKGNRIIVNGPHDSGVEVFDLESGSIQQLSSHPDYYRWLLALFSPPPHWI